MSAYQPPYSITSAILNRVVEVGELLGRWVASAEHASPQLRKENRIRTIQASLAIEHNGLSASQVTALMEGKRVLAPEKEIQEVRNAINAYEKLSAWNSHSLSDLLAAHRLLMAGLVDAPGHLRDGEVGIYREKRLLHMAPQASRVSSLINDLLDWLRHTDAHPLIASAVFHYEFEFIHPFTDGNGRMGRLWQTLILSEWRAELAWLPVETLVHHQQREYYRILGECDKSGDCTAFIAFMLDKLAKALRESVDDAEKRVREMSVRMSVQMSVKMSEENARSLASTAKRVLAIVAENPNVTIAQLAEALSVSARTIERSLKALQERGCLRRVGATKNGYWRVLA
ncbi:Fic family protein [Leminorella grimontii]|uniref:Fic family protein n=1 Tax=Leminorella grimontii TaxID=82981 RepID=UPI00207DD314|nr:Fic family protein [Leminorella grimontii]GKX60749.1 cell filamentation protein Fic [Leminorella grimontii]